MDSNYVVVMSSEAVGFIAALIFGTILMFYLCLWVARDVENRGENAILWTIMVMFTAGLASIIWLLSRPKKETITSHSSEYKLWSEKLAELFHVKRIWDLIKPNCLEKIGFDETYFFLFIIFLLRGINTFIGWLVGSSQFPLLYYGEAFIITLALWMSKYLRNNYVEAAEEIDLWPQHAKEVKSALFLTGFALIVGCILLYSGIIRVYGYDVQWGVSPFFLLFYFIMLFVYLPIVIDCFSLAFDINILFPWTIKSTGTVKFSDLRRRGGMEKVGKLFLRVAQFYFVGLAFVAVNITLQGQLLSWILNYSFPTLVGIGIVLFLIPVFISHNHMRKEKEGKLEDIKDKIIALGKEPGGRLEIDIEREKKQDIMGYIFLFLEHEQIYHTSEYPINIDDIRELVYSVVVPVLAHIATVKFL